MKHIQVIAVAKATDDTTVGDQVSSILAQVFSFITDLAETKGKGGTQTTA